MPLRRSISSCGFRSFEHLDQIPNKTMMKALLHQTGVWRRSCHSSVTGRKSDNSHHDLLESWYPVILLYTIES